MNFIINGAFKEDTSNPSSLPLSILPSSSVILATRKWVYRNFRQKKGGSFEPPYRKCSTLPYCGSIIKVGVRERAYKKISKK